MKDYKLSSVALKELLEPVTSEKHEIQEQDLRQSSTGLYIIHAHQKWLKANNLIDEIDPEFKNIELDIEKLKVREFAEFIAQGKLDESLLFAISNIQNIRTLNIIHAFVEKQTDLSKKYIKRFKKLMVAKMEDSKRV